MRGIARQLHHGNANTSKNTSVYAETKKLDDVKNVYRQNLRRENCLKIIQ